MKLSILLPLLSATSALASTQDDCRIHRPKVYQAIQRFCSNPNVRIPSAYAVEGKWDDQHKAQVRIDGLCIPTQWVPAMFCYGQFWEMCSKKERGKLYGRNGCQWWRVQYDGDKVMNWFPGKRDEGEGVGEREVAADEGE